MKNTTNFVSVVRIKKDYFEKNTDLIEVLYSEKVSIEKEKRMRHHVEHPHSIMKKIP